jgi:hypothetical protein
MATIDNLCPCLSEEEFFHFIKNLRQSRRVSSSSPSKTRKKGTDKLLSRLSPADKEILLGILKITS